MINVDLLLLIGVHNILAATTLFAKMYEYLRPHFILIAPYRLSTDVKIIKMYLLKQKCLFSTVFGLGLGPGVVPELWLDYSFGLKLQLQLQL